MTRKKIALFAIPILATIMIGGTLSPVFGGDIVGETCSDPGFICKFVEFFDEDEDGTIEVGERVDFDMVVMVNNFSPNRWDNTIMTDRFGAEIDVTSCRTFSGDAITTVTHETKGKSNKEFLKWDIGTLEPGDAVVMICDANTDLNPAGKAEYSTCGVYEFNSGAVLKFNVPDGSQRSFETGGLTVFVSCDNEDP